MIASGVVALGVLTVVVSAIAIQEATRYEDESRLRSLSTKFAAGVVIVWFAWNMVEEVHRRASFYELLSHRAFFRGVLALAIVWLVFFKNRRD